MRLPYREMRERTTLRSAVLSLILLFLGCSLLYVSTIEGAISSLPIRTLIANIGSLFLVTGVVTVAWELFGKRAFADEVRALFGVSKSFSIAGVSQYVNAFQSAEIDWDSLFHRTRNVDLLFMGNSGWRRNQFLNFETLVQREGSRLTVILPDPKDDSVIASAKARLGKPDANPKGYFEEACDYFKTLSNRFPSAHIEIWFIRQLPCFSVFRFDESAVVAFYSHRRTQVAVPVLVCHEGGALFDYVMSEVGAVVGRNQESPLGNLEYSSVNN